MYALLTNGLVIQDTYKIRVAIGLTLFWNNKVVEYRRVIPSACETIQACAFVVQL